MIYIEFEKSVGFFQSVEIGFFYGTYCTYFTKSPTFGYSFLGFKFKVKEHDSGGVFLYFEPL